MIIRCVKATYCINKMWILCSCVVLEVWVRVKQFMLFIWHDLLQKNNPVSFMGSKIEINLFLTLSTGIISCIRTKNGTPRFLGKWRENLRRDFECGIASHNYRRKVYKLVMNMALFVFPLFSISDILTLSYFGQGWFWDVFIYIYINCLAVEWQKLSTCHTDKFKTDWLRD